MIPTLEAAEDDGDVGGYGFIFDPSLRDGTVVYMSDTVLYVVGSPAR